MKVEIHDANHDHITTNHNVRGATQYALTTKSGYTTALCITCNDFSAETYEVIAAQQVSVAAWPAAHIYSPCFTEYTTARRERIRVYGYVEGFFTVAQPATYQQPQTAAPISGTLPEENDWDFSLADYKAERLAGMCGGASLTTAKIRGVLADLEIASARRDARFYNDVSTLRLTATSGVWTAQDVRFFEQCQIKYGVAVWSLALAWVRANQADAKPKLKDTTAPVTTINQDAATYSNNPNSRQRGDLYRAGLQKWGPVWRARATHANKQRDQKRRDEDTYKLEKEAHKEQQRQAEQTLTTDARGYVDAKLKGTWRADVLGVVYASKQKQHGRVRWATAILQATKDNSYGHA